LEDRIREFALRKDVAGFLLGIGYYGLLFVKKRNWCAE